MGKEGVLYVGLCLLFLVSVHSASIEIIDSSPPVNSRFCVRGPTYWCQNITTAKDCNAVKHCIQTVWELQTLPADDDSVCQICKDMVAQARAQLESNETQEELREVFEGSCKLIPIQIVQKECIKLSDEFIPELVETLASQMNPQVVCAVAGLCNNARIDALLGSESSEETSNEITSPDSCQGCATVAQEIEKKLFSTPKDTILNNIVEACGRLGSFSDGCAAIVITHFESIHAHLMKNFNGDGLCHLSGMCQYKFHTHEDDGTVQGIEVVHTSSVGMLNHEKGDGACEMCEQLVLHLRDFLVANTTETEFEQVLKGLCKQFKSFKTQCLSIVEEYYSVIYDFLVSELDPKGAKEVCSLLAICRPPTLKQGPLWPLLPTEAVHNYEAHKAAVRDNVDPASRPIIGQDEANSLHTVNRVSLNGGGVGVRVADSSSWTAALPVDRMMPQAVTYVSNKQVCTFCEYLLHYIQVALTTPTTESEIRKVVGQACDHLPHTIDEQCRSFVDTYGDALVALLAQEIDPSQMCPKLGLCPASQVLVDITHAVNDKPICPLCLFAVEELITKLKDNKTEEGIRKALDELCQDLPKSLVGECRTFVENYSEELVDMIVADFSPQEVCVYLKLCDPPSISSAPDSSSDEILTNDIPQLPVKVLIPKIIVNGETENVQSHVEESTSCVLCEFVLSKIDSALKDKTTEDEIKHVVHDVCNWMPKTVVAECNKFVDQYADLVITLLAQNMDPKEVCTEIKLCEQKLQPVAVALDQCVMCDALMGALEGALQDPTIDKDAAKALQKVCTLIPKKDEEKCTSMVKIYGPSILNLLARETPINYICEKLGLCAQNRQVVSLLGGKRCTWGPGYWCQSVSHAKSCGAIAHCQERVWKADKPAE